MLSYKPPQEQFKRKEVPVGVLVEGKFESVFKNRLTPRVSNAGEIQFKESSEETQMLFISDADLIRNEYNKKTNEYYALGFDKYTKQIYANKEFFMNSINYMVDESGLILSNTKSFKIRLLNKQLIEKHRTLIQAINTVAPVILIILIGLILNFIRKRKYTVRS